MQGVGAMISLHQLAETFRVGCANCVVPVVYLAIFNLPSVDTVEYSCACQLHVEQNM